MGALSGTLGAIFTDLGNGATFSESHSYTVDVADFDFTGVSVRADVRRSSALKGAALLSLTSAAETANGSGILDLTVSGGGAVLTFVYRIAPADSDALPYDEELTSDVEIVFADDVHTPLRYLLTPRGSATHE